MSARRTQKKKIDTIEKLAALVAESMEDLRTDMGTRFDGIGDQISALRVRLSRIERHLELPEAA
jgi:hypothetical protein